MEVKSWWRSNPALPHFPTLPSQVLLLPVAGIQPFIFDQTIGKSAGAPTLTCSTQQPQRRVAQ